MSKIRLTKNQLFKACKKHNYLLVRDTNNQLIGLNSKVAKLIKNRKNEKLSLIGYQPCDFHTYLSFKIPFISLGRAL